MCQGHFINQVNFDALNNRLHRLVARILHPSLSHSFRARPLFCFPVLFLHIPRAVVLMCGSVIMKSSLVLPAPLKT